MESVLQLVLALMALFIILLVLVQRGRGGGLAGALGGPGGSSAFGAKAGDTFTRITIIAVTVWIVTCLFASIWAARRGDAFGSTDAPLAGAVSTDVQTGIGVPPADPAVDPAAETPAADAPATGSADAAAEPAADAAATTDPDTP